jgi:anti-sigma regulatory factor (Ser/Thr protein kinase)
MGMTRYRERTWEIRQFILDNVDEHPTDITALTIQKFGISRPAVLRHIRNLIADDLLVVQGKTRDRCYALKPIADATFALPITPKLEEDRVWRQRIRPLLEKLPRNVLDICAYGFTEMMNNVVDHSEGSKVLVTLTYTTSTVQMMIWDDGVGIFHKIQTELGLEDQHHTILELAKGKLTTDPEQHTGEGIFFTSRAFDKFGIRSHDLFFTVSNPGKGVLIDDHEAAIAGTCIVLNIDPRSDRSLTAVFDKYTVEDDDYGFSRTIVPVELARYGDENLVSRSQAKRLLARFDRFKEVVLDFERVEVIGQAFADEVFRVYPGQNPHVHLTPINTNEQVWRMVLRAVGGPQKALELWGISSPS